MTDTETETEIESESNLDTDEEVDASLCKTLDMPVGVSGNLRTVYVFVDLPIHYEFRAGLQPLLPVGSKIVFDPITIRDMRSKRSKIIEGSHMIVKRIIKYGSRPSLSGLTQYLEVKYVNK